MSLNARLGPMEGIRGEASVPHRIQKSRNEDDVRVVIVFSFEPETRIRGWTELETLRSNGAYHQLRPSHTQTTHPIGNDVGIFCTDKIHQTGIGQTSCQSLCLVWYTRF